VGASNKRVKPPKVNDAEITEDGCLIVDMNCKVYPHTSQAVFTPELVLRLIQEYGDIPPSDYNDYPGVPIVTEESVFAEKVSEKRTEKSEPEEKGGSE